MRFLLQGVSGRFNLNVVYKQTFQGVRMGSSGLLLIGTVILLTMIHPSSAFADDQPQLCKQDGGKTWYFSLGRVVFDLPATILTDQQSDPGGFFEINDIDPKDAIIPPDPSAPIGCLKNPQQLSDIQLEGWPIFGRYDYPQRDFPGQMPHSLSSINLDYDPISASIREEKGESPLFPSDSSCGNWKFKRIFPNGTIYCTSNADGLTNPDAWPSGWMLLVPNNVYQLPLPWERFELLRGFEDIQATYWLSDFILINYTTLFPSSPTATLIERSIDFDKAIRSSVTAAEIPNYKWP